jgi:hypothetical protein
MSAIVLGNLFISDDLMDDTVLNRHFAGAHHLMEQSSQIWRFGAKISKSADLVTIVEKHSTLKPHLDSPLLIGLHNKGDLNPDTCQQFKNFRIDRIMV